MGDRNQGHVMGGGGPETTGDAGSAIDASVLRVGDIGELVAGLVGGCLAFVAGYGLLFLVKGDQIMSNFFAGMGAGGTGASQLQAAGLTLPDQWQVVGLVYQTSHNVPYSATVSAGTRRQTFTFGREFLAGDLLPWLLPMVVLFLAGFAVAYALRASRSARGGAAGAKVAAGYALAAIGTAFLFTWSATLTRSGVSRSVSIGPDLLSTLLFAGIVYPLVFAGLGGVVAASLQSSAR